MKLNPFCMCCALNKQEQKIRHYPDMEKKTEYMKKVMALMANTEEKDCAPSLSVDIQKLYSSFWNCPMEDFTEIKKEFNQLMLNMEVSIEDKIRKSNDPLEKGFSMHVSEIILTLPPFPMLTSLPLLLFLMKKAQKLWMKKNIKISSMIFPPPKSLSISLTTAEK